MPIIDCVHCSADAQHLTSSLPYSNSELSMPKPRAHRYGSKLLPGGELGLIIPGSLPSTANSCLKDSRATHFIASQAQLDKLGTATIHIAHDLPWLDWEQVELQARVSEILICFKMLDINE